MNTDEEKAKEMLDKGRDSADSPSQDLRHLAAGATRLKDSCFFLSVFICVHLWFQSIYPTEAS
jgi:hypothetical protein